MISVTSTPYLKARVYLIRTLVAIALFHALVIPKVGAAPCAKEQTNSPRAKQEQIINTDSMKKVLIIGMNPHAIDFANSELPKGLTVEAIEQGTQATLSKLTTIGYDAELFLIEKGATNLNDLAEQLRKRDYDGVVVGNGIRGIKANFIVFEQIINIVHFNAPKSKIIFNNLPTDTDEAVKRWM